MDLTSTNPSFDNDAVTPRSIGEIKMRDDVGDERRRRGRSRNSWSSDAPIHFKKCVQVK